MIHKSAFTQYSRHFRFPAFVKIGSRQRTRTVAFVSGRFNQEVICQLLQRFCSRVYAGINIDHNAAAAARVMVNRYIDIRIKSICLIGPSLKGNIRFTGRIVAADNLVTGIRLKPFNNLRNHTIV
ncbi:hypothetical protein SDC9_209464 [bioreactor metagenome]|uniref:Uncharacterized protein n=1 Tax=bioreactor metagenome TaxID=1076179 RepID=A0A645JEX1_9ZZZZ